MNMFSFFMVKMWRGTCTPTSTGPDNAQCSSAVPTHAYLACWLARAPRLSATILYFLFVFPYKSNYHQKY